MSRDAREELAAAQATIVRALLADGPISEGFRRDHVIAARQVLRDKQARLAERRAHGRTIEARAPTVPPPTRLRRLWQRLRGAR